MNVPIIAYNTWCMPLLTKLRHIIWEINGHWKNLHILITSAGSSRTLQQNVDGLLMAIDGYQRKTDAPQLSPQLKTLLKIRQNCSQMQCSMLCPTQMDTKQSATLLNHHWSLDSHFSPHILTTVMTLFQETLNFSRDDWNAIIFDPFFNKKDLSDLLIPI